MEVYKWVEQETQVEASIQIVNMLHAHFHVRNS